MSTKETSAGVIIYRKTNEGLKFLLLYYGGRYWGFPKGKLDSGERSFKAALREVREETGIRPKDLHFGEVFKISDNFGFSRKGKEVDKTVTYYLARSKTSRVMISEYHQGYGWFSLKEAERVIIHENLRKIIKKAAEAIGEGK